MSRPLEPKLHFDIPTRSRPAAYENDYFAWTQDQLRALRLRRTDELDLENLAEEIGDLGISVKREINSRLLVLLTHLLKWKYQKSHRSNSWKASIVEQRRAIGGELRSSPSLKRYPASVLTEQYETARLAASGETGLDLHLFPELCPFSTVQALDPAFYPEDD